MDEERSRSCKILILSHTPPYPCSKTASYHALRSWGLAKGLKEEYPDFSITIAYEEYDPSISKKSSEGIFLAVWKWTSLQTLITQHHTIITHYALDPRILEYIPLGTQLILDCAVPIFLEESSNIDREYYHFQSLKENYNAFIKRADLFLCAHETQRVYLLGILSALGRVNPLTYKQKLIEIVPYGLFRNEPTSTQRPISNRVKGNFFKLLHFGGLYPWMESTFNLLISAVIEMNKKIPTKLVMVGSENPIFHLHQGQLLKDRLAHDPHARRYVILHKWIAYHERTDWYLDSDLIVLLNPHDSLETNFSWRTRLMDYLVADVAIATNGKDLLGEQLILWNAAARIDEKNLAYDLTSLLLDRDYQCVLKRNVGAIRERFYWDLLTRPLASRIIQGHRAADLKKNPKQRILRKIQKRSNLIPIYSTFISFVRHTKQFFSSTLRRRRKH